MLQVDAPVFPDKKVVAVPLESLTAAKPFNGTPFNLRMLDWYKLVNAGDTDRVLMPWTMDTIRRLALHDIMVPGPIRWEYHWPTKHPRPLDHQVVTADFLTQNPRAFVFNEIGTSKTLSALWAAEFLKLRGEINKVLIVSTLSSLERVWELEIFENLIGRRFVNLHGGTAASRNERLAQDADYYIINHDGLKVMEEALTPYPFDLVILDEGAIFRNQRTGLWRSCFNICGMQTNRWLWWMTGSPMPKAPTDVWAQAKIVRPDTVPKYFGTFRGRCMYQVNKHKWVPLSGYEQIVYDMIRPVIRYERDVCDLPKDYTQSVPVTLSTKQQKAYDEMAATLALEIEQGLITAANEGVKLLKLQQIAAGAIYKPDGDIVYLDPQPKFDALDEIFEFSERKLIVYAPFKYCLPMIAEHYQKQGVSVGVVSGGVATGTRNKIFQEFQEGDLEMIVAHPECMAHAVTLTKSFVITWWSPIDDFEIEEQACGRIKRTSQTREQYVMQLVATPVERGIYKRNASKDRAQGLVMELFKKGVDTSHKDA